MGKVLIVQICIGTLLLGINNYAVAQEGNFSEAWELSDFALDLNASLAPGNHVWVGSGQMTVQPQANKVFGVGEWNAPPLAGRGFLADVVLRLNGYEVRDDASHGKGDVGILYQGGTWYPHKVVRRGTYQHFVNGQKLSLHAQSTLVPMVGANRGFILKIKLKNRSKDTVHIEIKPDINGGWPIFRPLERWEFSRPWKAEKEAVPSGDQVWQNDQVRITLHTDLQAMDLASGETVTKYMAHFFSKSGIKVAHESNFAELIEKSTVTWKNRLKWATKNIPRLTTDIPGMQKYYYRSVASGLVSIWEHPDFVSQPFLATGGMDGGAVCAYVWDNAGYVPKMNTLMLGEHIHALARNLATIDLTENYAVTPAGTGIGVSYAYSTWAFVSLVWEIFRHYGPDEHLYQQAKRLVLNAEQIYPEWHGLMDFGKQKNLLEMRSTGWQHFVASPNAERAWNLDRLADMAGLLDIDVRDTTQWRQKAKEIRQAVLDELWDEEIQWFVSRFPDGTVDKTYSVQVFDAIRAGVGDESIKNAVFSHLVEGKFLGKYGISSVSREDSVHYEVNDPDWSGGGAYMGEGPQLALTLYELDRPQKAWDILKRFFWMGQHLAYFPQEQMADRPETPAHKRANIISGLGGAEAILYGLAGIEPQPDGSLWIDPKPPSEGSILLTGYGFRGHIIDIQIESDFCSVVVDGKIVYKGEIKRVKVI